MLIQSFPQNTILLAASSWPGDLTKKVIDTIKQHQPDLLTDFQQQNEMMTQMGLPTLTETITKLQGTIAIAVTPSAPFPAATVVIPRSAEIDQLLGFAAAQMNFDLSQTAIQPTALPIPNIPVSVFASQGDTYWTISSDINLITAIDNQTPQLAGSRIAAAMDRQGFDSQSLLAIDLKELATVGQLYLPMAMMGVRDPDKQQILVK